MNSMCICASKHEVVQKTFEKCFAHEQAGISVQGLKVPSSEEWVRLAEHRWVSEDLKTVRLVLVRKSSICSPTFSLIQVPQKLCLVHRKSVSVKHSSILL